MLKTIALFLPVLAFAFELSAPATVSDQKKMIKRYEAIVQADNVRLERLDITQRRRLLKIVSENEVAKLSSSTLYDPPQNNQPKGEIGYCYGRGMASHLLARKMGLAEESIMKIFAAGDMKNGTIRWRFHMATLVLGDDNLFYVIDPIMPGLIRRYNNQTGNQYDPDSPMLPALWIEIVKHFYDNTTSILAANPDLSQNPNFKNTIKFYIAPSDAIMVDMREVPANIETENGKRIIEVLFNPKKYPGFKPQFLTEEDRLQDNPAYYVVEDVKTLDQFFTVYDEPLTEQFNFYRMDVTIFYIKDDVLGTAVRNYLYNGVAPGANQFQTFDLGYFPSLLKSIENFSEVF